MFNLIKHIILVNAIAALTVFILSNNVTAFEATNLVDFLFYTVIIIWVVAKLTWEGGMHSKTYNYDDSASSRVQSMVEHDFESDKRRDAQLNYQFGFVMFLAGLPAFIACFILQFLA